MRGWRRFIAVALLAASATGWDTSEVSDKSQNWAAIYNPPGYNPPLTSTGEIDPERLIGNEHAEMAHAVMAKLGWSPSLFQNPSPPRVLALNAVFHKEVRAIQAPAGSADGSSSARPLERIIPHPAMFAGVPDVSYTVYDFLNKNAYCPPLPPDARDIEACHAFRIWLGAILNSSHFGDQAREMYKHYHRVALALADKARAMRESIQGQVEFTDWPRPLDYVREAELEALVYESVAQHYLQDRWSSGHMWNRWNGPSWLALEDDVRHHEDITVGVIAGLIHGAEAVIKQLGYPYTMQHWPDPMCSPLISGGTATPVLYQGFDGVLWPAVGDYRYRDMKRQLFGGQYGYSPEMPLVVEVQDFDLDQCSAAGYADVARRFGLNMDNTVGEHRLPIRWITPTFDATFDTAKIGRLISIRCWEHYATNQAMWTGISRLGQGKVGRVAAKALSMGARGRLVEWASGGKYSLRGGDFARVYKAIKTRAKKAPDETDLARGHTLPALNGVASGDAYLEYLPPDYAEPIPESLFSYPDFDLPGHVATYGQPSDADRVGRDASTIKGFFNRAHLGYWCTAAPTVLARADLELLPLDDPGQALRWPVPLPAGGGAAPSAAEQTELDLRLDACVMLADRLHYETNLQYLPSGSRSYTGFSSESRQSGHRAFGAGEPAAPPCKVFNELPFGIDADPDEESSWQDNPYWMHPGYVVAEVSGDPATGPYATETRYDATYYKSLVNWCRSLPVVNIATAEDVAVDDAGDPIVVTPGYDSAGAMSFDPAVIDPEVTIHGFNFGTTEGRIKLESESGCVDPVMTSEFPDIVSWSDRAITFRVIHNRFPPDLYRIIVIRDDRDANQQRVRSVGRARLDVRRSVFTGIRGAGAPLPTTATDMDTRVVHPYCVGGTVLHHAITDCTDVAAADLVYCGLPSSTQGTELWAHPAPVGGANAGPYPEHQWTITDLGECASLPFFELCPPGFPLWYGLVYELARLSTAPIGVVPERQWRFTLAWARAGAPP